MIDWIFDLYTRTTAAPIVPHLKNRPGMKISTFNFIISFGKSIVKIPVQNTLLNLPSSALTGMFQKYFNPTSH